MICMHQGPVPRNFVLLCFPRSRDVGERLRGPPSGVVAASLLSWLCLEWQSGLNVIAGMVVVLLRYGACIPVLYSESPAVILTGY
jgi:hypothetical protein